MVLQKKTPGDLWQAVPGARMDKIELLCVIVNG